MKRTPLFKDLENAGGRMIDFLGWEMPVQFVGVKEEHNQVRSSVGLFDVSHMGEIFVRGPLSFETLQWLTSNNVDNLKAGKAQYTLLTNENGGIIDDVIVYCIKDNEEYLVCANAGNIHKDFQWMQAHSKGAEIINESSLWAQIAIQGPDSIKVLTKVLGDKPSEIKYFNFCTENFEGTELIIAKSGYTGELGAEIFVPNDQASSLWQKLMDAGKEFNILPIGLAARDTLRLEMKYSLYGQEITEDTNPIEAGLGFAVKLDKGEFIGREAIAKIKEEGPKRKLVGFQIMEKGIPRHDYKLLAPNDEEIGHVTSGTMSPTLGQPIGIGYVNSQYSELGSEIFVEIRNRKVKAQIVKCPFIEK